MGRITPHNGCPAKLSHKSSRGCAVQRHVASINLQLSRVFRQCSVSVCKVCKCDDFHTIIPSLVGKDACTKVFSILILTVALSRYLDLLWICRSVPEVPREL